MIKNIKSIIVSAILISLAACGGGVSQNTQSNAPAANPPQTTPSPQATTEATEPTETITFKEPVAGKSFGYFESINNAKAATQTIDFSKPLVLSGWALSSDLTKAADSVIITYGDNNTVATTVPVDVARPDVAQALKNKTLTKSGWVAKIDPATLNLTDKKAQIKAWSYNSQTKEAYPLGNSYEIVRK